MIYSVHNATTGLFDYYEGGPATAINDDLPTPQLRGGKLGVAAISAGRPLPAAAKPKGSGALPVGSISTGSRGSWKGAQKALPSGLGALGESFMPWPDRTLHAAAITTLAGAGIASAGAAGISSGSKRIAFAAASAVLLAWPICSVVRDVLIDIERARWE